MSPPVGVDPKDGVHGPLAESIAKLIRKGLAKTFHSPHRHTVKRSSKPISKYSLFKRRKLIALIEQIFASQKAKSDHQPPVNRHHFPPALGDITEESCKSPPWTQRGSPISSDQMIEHNTLVEFHYEHSEYSVTPSGSITFALQQHPTTWIEVSLGSDSMTVLGRIINSLKEIAKDEELAIQRLLLVGIWVKGIEVMNKGLYKKHEDFWIWVWMNARTMIREKGGLDRGYICWIRGLEGDNGEAVLGKFKHVLVDGELYACFWRGNLEWYDHVEGWTMRVVVGYNAVLPALVFS